MIKNQIQRIKDIFAKLLAERTSPSAVARGMAAGIFMGTVPVMGFQLIGATFIGYRIKGNIIAAGLGCWIGNPFLYYFNYLTGCLFIPGYQIIETEQFTSLLSDLSFVGAFDLGEQIFIPLFGGSLIVALVLSIISFYITRIIYARYFNKKFNRAI